MESRSRDWEELGERSGHPRTTVAHDSREERRHRHHRRHHDSSSSRKIRKEEGDEGRVKRRRKERHRRHERRRSRSKDDIGGEEEELERGRAAFRALRELLGYQYDLKNDMKELLCQLDAGKSLDISEIPDAYVLGKLTEVFGNTRLIRKRSNGTYVGKRKGVMDLLGPILEENKDELVAVYQEGQKRDKVVPEVARSSHGPMMPTREQLEEAEQLMMEQEYQQHKDTVDDGADVVGPVIPDGLGEEYTSDERMAEVVRILEILEVHRRKDLRGKDAAPIPPNPYEILNIERQSTPAEIKKKFFKLSLVTHPDKNEHPQAAVAFEAVSTASKRLQDSKERENVHAQIAHLEDERIRRDLQSKKEREQAWKVARGEMQPEDIRPSRNTREAWMTDLPSNKVTGVNSRSFRSSKPQEQDHSWAQIPGQQQCGPQLLPKAMHHDIPGDLQQNNPIVNAKRGKSMLEKHIETQQRAAADESRNPGPTVGGKVYRPFNREEDLEIRKAADPSELFKRMKGLDSKFGRGSG